MIFFSPFNAFSGYLIDWITGPTAETKSPLKLKGSNNVISLKITQEIQQLNPCSQYRDCYCQSEGTARLSIPIKREYISQAAFPYMGNT